MSGQADVFRFMALRAGTGDVSGARLDLVTDDAYHAKETIKPPTTHVPSTPHLSGQPAGLYEVDLFSQESLSPIGKLVFNTLYGESTTRRTQSRSETEALKQQIINAAEASLVGGLTYTLGEQSITLPPTIRTIELGGSLTPAGARAFATLGKSAHYVKGTTLYVLPTKIHDLAAPTEKLGNVLDLMRNALLKRPAEKSDTPSVPKVDELGELSKKIGAVLGDIDSLMAWVFTDEGTYARGFELLKRMQFDTLYALYMLRKRERVPLEPITDALITLNAIELLALGRYFQQAMQEGKLPAKHAKVISVLESAYPGLVNWDPSAEDADAALSIAGVPRIATLEDLARCLMAKPVVHPLFARLAATLKPFNALQPVGIGDLKVVKQTFLGYSKGEISHVETVLAGESKKHQHRSLDRVEDAFTALSSQDSEVVRDNQSTSRFELKDEVEDTLKTDLGINAGASFTYKGNPVVDASVTAGMTFSSSREISDKTSRSFVNEVMAKATSRVQTRVSQTRSQNRLSETEVTVNHEFVNTGTDHVSGIYRWLDKVYEGQVYNYGKRLMFEFVLPEPAAFLVESRLYAYLMSLDLPRHPGDTGKSNQKTMPVKEAAEIDEAKYQTLARDFDLRELPYPKAVIDSPPLSVLANEGGDASFKIAEKYTISRGGIKTQVYNGYLPEIPAGYFLHQVFVSGSAEFAAIKEPARDKPVQNTLIISFGQREVFRMVDEQTKNWSDFSRANGNAVYTDFTESDQVILPSKFSINITDHTCTAHDLRFSVTLGRSSATYTQWQQAVYDAVYKQFNAAAADQTDPAAVRIAEYMDKLDKINAPPINEIIQGTSSSANEAVMKRELKRQCVAMIAKEFDSDSSDDVAGNLDATAPWSVDMLYPSLTVDAVPAPKEDPTASRRSVAHFQDFPDVPLSKFTTVNVATAQKKGVYVQFLEQAFEWEHLSSLCYPYFWAKRPRWVELMSREDPADPMFTEFLQAGSVRVLLAVKPGYESAVLHFLATREPWEGGPSPVIGDPLFIPLYQEVHNRQDNLAGSVPQGEPWIFTLPTSLIYLESQKYPLTMEYKPTQHRDEPLDPPAD